MNLKRHDDDEWFDEVRITTVPRYKTSGLSGDEWRRSARIELLRKGKVQSTTSLTKMLYAIMDLPHVWLQAEESWNNWDEEMKRGLCMQPGCSKPATVTYRYKAFYSRDGTCEEPQEPTYIVFCDEHKERGDCGLEDCDANYQDVTAPDASAGKEER